MDRDDETRRRKGTFLGTCASDGSLLLPGINVATERRENPFGS